MQEIQYISEERQILFVELYKVETFEEKSHEAAIVNEKWLLFRWETEACVFPSRFRQ